MFADKGKVCVGNSTGQLSLEPPPCVRQGSDSHSSPLSTLIDATAWGSPRAKATEFLFPYLNPRPPITFAPTQKYFNNPLSQAEKVGFTEDEVSVRANAYTLLHALSNYPTFFFYINSRNFNKPLGDLLE